jgi:hypothetical protein
MARWISNAGLLRTGCLILLASLWPLPSAATSQDVVVLTLDGVVATECSATWVEAGVTLSFVPTTSEDCTLDRCSFGIDSDGIWLYPSRFQALLGTSLGRVVAVDVDITDYCGTNCTRAFLYSGALTVDTSGNSSNGAQTLHLEAGDNSVDRLAVSSCEGKVTEIRLRVDPLPIEATHWSTVKILYRDTAR